jgi:Mycothiol maleylpyruvate isomerase N-terminal domain
MTMDIDRLLQEEEAGWQRLQAALNSIPADRLSEPTLTPEGWSVKDAMFHMAYWLDDCARVLATIEAGTFDAEAEEALDIPSLNDEGFERSRDMDAGTVLVALSAARDQARSAFTGLGAVTPEAWEWFDESAPLHYRKHQEDLDAWLEG